MQSGAKRIIKKSFKVIAWLVAATVMLVVAIALLIRIPAIQTWLTGKAVTFLEDKIGSKVELGGIKISFPKNILLEDLYLEDRQGDTLLYAGRLSVDTDLWALTQNELQLNSVALERTVAFVDRADNDSAFNYTYIIDSFAGDSTAVPDTLEQKGWNISLEALKLKDIRLHYDDRLMGNFVSLSLGEFDLNMNVFDLEKNAYQIGDILLQNTAARIRQTKIPPPSEKVEDTQDSAAALALTFGVLSINNVELDYEQSALGQRLQTDIGAARIVADHIDLPNQEIALKTLSIEETEFRYQKSAADTILPDAPANQDVAATAEEGMPWKVSLAKLNLARNNIQFYDLTKPQQEGVVDFDHLRISQLNADAEDIRYEDDNMNATLGDLSFRERSGFEVRSFSGQVTLTSQQATIDNLILETGNSTLQLQATATFKSLKDIGLTYPSAGISADISQSHIGLGDILYFNPHFLDSIPLELTANTNVNINATLRGSVENLSIERFVLSSLQDTYLQTSGRITGLPRIENLRMDLSLDKLYTTRNDLETILPDTLLPDSLQLPGWINLSAKYAGSLDRANFTTGFTSDAGSIQAQGNFNLDSLSDSRGVNAVLSVDDLDVGGILGKADTVMGKLAMKADIQARGLSLPEMTGTFSASVDRFGFQNYDYRDLKLNGSIRDQVVAVAANMDDRNLDFSIDARYDIRQEVPRYDITFDLKNADFEALNLSGSPLRARGTLLVNLATADFRILNGNVGIRKVAVFNGDDLYAVDSLLFASIDQEGRSEISIDSDLLQARFEGSINIFGLPGVMREYLDSYYSIADSVETPDSAPQHFRFKIDLKNTDLLTNLLVPKLTSFDPGPITGEFDSESNRLDLKMTIKSVQYSNIGLDSMVFSTNSDASALRYNLMFDKILVDSMKIDGLQFNGTIGGDSIITDIVVLDSADREKYVLAGTLLSRDKGMELKLAPQGILLNYARWAVPPDNIMRFGGEKFVASNVQLTNGREKIMIESAAQPGTPISIGFRQLNVESLTSMIAEQRPVSGLLQGDIELFPQETGLTFTSDLTLNDFEIKSVAWGDIALQVSQTVRDRFDVMFTLSGGPNEVNIQGYYLGGQTPSMNIAADINRFRLASLQPLLADQFQGLKGLLTGEIRVGGTPERPDIDGGILLRETEFLSTFMNTNFTIDDERISFVDEGIAFKAFEIADRNGNKARIDGTVLTATYRDFRFNLDIVTDNFRLLNTTEKDNDLFYGQVGIKANARIRGDMTTPVVNLDIGMTKGSKLTYVVPQSEASALQAEGIVKFVDRTFEGDPFMRSIEPETSDTIKSVFRGIDLTAKVELSDDESFTIIIDPLTKDQLTVQGNSTLTLQVDPSGDINLTGRYEISKGTYNLSFYKFVKREFQIESGSSITWMGDPLNAQMDIRAIFNVETSPIELFANQLTGADPNEVNQYKQRLPFLVYLNLKGELLQPEISFKLEMPMDQRNAFGGNVYARLQDINTRESDLNKQVFALLILKRFISDDPFQNRAGGGLESTARNSVSKILSEQLNRLSQNIKGVELSFDIKSYEDYTSGQAHGQTELQLGVSKSLLNDRLVVKLSGNIDIEGENPNRDATDYIGDLALEYKLTPDGRFRITGFRNSNYDMIDGELTETGAGLIYVKDYNTLNELFKANAETRN